MIVFDPSWRGLDVIQDSPPGDGLAISFLPSVVSDVAASVAQLQSESSVTSFMAEQFRATAENMAGAGAVVSSWG